MAVLVMNTEFRIILLNFALLTHMDGLILIHRDGVSLMTKRSNSILPCRHRWQSGWTKTSIYLRLPKIDADAKFISVCVFAAISLFDCGLLRRAGLLVVDSIQGFDDDSRVAAVGSLPQE